MKSPMRSNLKMAMAGMRATKGRSLLTMLGVVIGIVAVVTVVGIGEGVKNQVAAQINHFGKDLITVRPGHVVIGHDAHKLSNTDLMFGLNSVSGLTAADLQAAQKAAGVGLVAPLGIVPGDVQAVSNGRKLPNALVIATNASLPRALNQSVPLGEFFSESDEGAYTAVIGQTVAQSLFQENAPLGQTFTFRGQTFIVRGIFDDFDSTPLSGTADFNDAIFIPYQTGELLTSNSLQFYSILAKPAKSSGTQAAIASITSGLRRERGGQQDFSVLNQQQNIEATSNVLDLLTTLISGVAAISLLVGGVGIMNIMLVSVTERMHEIGVRKAVGASERQILNQFMLEALVLSGAGGLLGIIISLVVDLLLRAYTSLRPAISWRAMVIATLVSMIIGVVFGVAPAIKAARKDPIEALRHE